MLDAEDRHLKKDVLVCRPPQRDYSLLARVDGDEVVFADDFGRPLGDLRER